MTYSDAIQFLYSLRWFGAKFGLANTLKLAELAGNPHQKLRFIHVAGTNGKGSTCAMLESIYRAAGLRVGLFTSPHLVSFRERIQANRRLISETDVARLVSDSRAWLAQGWPVEVTLPATDARFQDHPTFFEVVTIMALRYFLEQRCDLVIWETGLGGRLDATNIVCPLASVITNIQYDHQQWLGSTLASIASEKAGIIKSGIPVITATEDPEALRVLQETARRLDAPFVRVSPREMETPPLSEITIPLLGRHQRINAAIALATVRVLAARIPVLNDAITAGLSRIHWPGRLQLVERPFGQKVLLDGAHNADGAEILASALREFFPSARRTLILGILRDKDWQRMCEILAPLASRIILVPVPSERSATPGELSEISRSANPGAQILESNSLSEALAASSGDEFVVIAGSFYLIGEAMELLELSPPDSANESRLNEWQVSPTQHAV